MSTSYRIRASSFAAMLLVPLLALAGLIECPDCGAEGHGRRDCSFDAHAHRYPDLIERTCGE